MITQSHSSHLLHLHSHHCFVFVVLSLPPLPLSLPLRPHGRGGLVLEDEIVRCRWVALVQLWGLFRLAWLHQGEA